MKTTIKTKPVITNNTITFPTVLASRFRTNLTTDTVEIVGNEDKFIFYGDKIVLKFAGITPNTSDMWLYFQIIEHFQKRNYVLDDKTEEEHNKYLDNCLSLEAKKELFESYKLSYKNELDKIYGVEEKKAFLRNKIDLEIERRKQEIESILYITSKQNVVIDINISDLLKDRGLANDIHNKTVIANSLSRLSRVGIDWFIMNDKLVEEVKALKKSFNNNSSLYMNDLTALFKKRITKTDLYIRNLLEGVNITSNFSSAKIYLDKGFFDLTLRSQKFDFSILKTLKGNTSKTLFVNLNFAFKHSMTKEYLYSVLSLKEDTRDDKKLSTAKTAISELIKNNILTSESGYDKSTQTFKFFLTEDFYIKSGYKAKQSYSLKQKEKDNKKSKVSK